MSHSLSADLSELKNTWDKQYEGDVVTALKDDNLFKIESEAIVREIKKHVTPGAEVRLLELGCGTGELLKNIKKEMLSASIECRLTGVDFSSSAILAAQEKSLERIDFVQADFASFLSETRDRFDIVISQRSIMALMEEEAQLDLLKLIKERMTSKAVGVVSECFVDALEKFNSYRERAGLEPLQKVWHSRYLKESLFTEVFSEVSFYHFCSTYMLTTRIIYPMFEEPRHNQAIHSLASTLPESGDYSFLKMAVFKL